MTSDGGPCCASIESLGRLTVMDKRASSKRVPRRERCASFNLGALALKRKVISSACFSSLHGKWPHYGMHAIRPLSSSNLSLKLIQACDAFITYAVHAGAVRHERSMKMRQDFTGQFFEHFTSGAPGHEIQADMMRAIYAHVL